MEGGEVNGEKGKIRLVLVLSNSQIITEPFIPGLVM